MTWDVDPDGDGNKGKYDLTGVEGDAVGWKAHATWGSTIGFDKDRYVQSHTGWVEKP
jgi:hypothetical protein